jgi:hypothetical protein
MLERMMRQCRSHKTPIVQTVAIAVWESLEKYCTWVRPKITGDFALVAGPDRSKVAFSIFSLAPSRNL